MARTAVATDDFNRTSGSPGANWRQTKTSYDVRIYLDTVVTGSATQAITSGNHPSIEWVGSGTFSDDQYSEITVSGFVWQSVNYNCGVIVRSNGGTDSTRSYYAASVAANTNGPTYTTTLFKVINNVYTELYTASQTWANGDKISLEAEGTELRLCRNGTPLGGSWTVTDSDLSSGLPGVCAAGNSAYLVGDDWEGGNLTSAATAIKRSLLLGIG